MPDMEKQLDLADFTGLLIDNSLTALIKSLESQVQWREQFLTLDRLNESQLVANITDTEIQDWIAEGFPELFTIMEQWASIKPKDKIDLAERPELARALSQLLEELEGDNEDLVGNRLLLIQSEFRAVWEQIRVHLATAAKRRLNLMKEMGLPALVAERVEIRTRMNLQSNVKDDFGSSSPSARAPEQGDPAPDGRASGQSRRREPLMTPLGNKGDRVEGVRRTTLAKPVAANITGKLADLESMRTKLGATDRHSISVSAQPVPHSGGDQSINAEITIVLRSHFF